MAQGDRVPMSALMLWRDGDQKSAAAAAEFRRWKNDRILKPLHEYPPTPTTFEEIVGVADDEARRGAR